MDSTYNTLKPIITVPRIFRFSLKSLGDGFLRPRVLHSCRNNEIFLRVRVILPRTTQVHYIIIGILGILYVNITIHFEIE